ncbi:hypothetical protein ACIRP3_41620 [Streptomyces sp. NPDC101209]|uniref:DUF6197 family protein n=1 Tax=Streptomyces sp. NPDC101209 TaxID=3366129 RepID=UPI003826A3BF
MPTTPATAPHAPAPADQPSTGTGAALSLDARLAATEAAMTVRLEEAAVAHEVRTAHLSSDPVDLADVITVPEALPRLPALAPHTYPTPAAAVLARAQHRMENRGWCAGALTDASGATCMMGAIRAEAGGDRGLEAHALALLRDVIGRRFAADPDDVSVPNVNDRQRDGRLPARMLGEAAGLADARGL